MMISNIRTIIIYINNKYPDSNYAMQIRPKKLLQIYQSYLFGEGQMEYLKI